MSSITFPEQLRLAETHLAGCRRLGPIVTRVGACTLTPNPDLFRVLVGSLISQFISTTAAKAIVGRLETKLRGRVTPARVLKLSEADLKACGISGAKARAVRGAAEQFRSRRFAQDLAAADDATARQMLLPLYGVGPWTVDMVLIFAGSRLDVWPTGDFAVRAGVRDLFGLSALPGPRELEQLGEPWRPFRSIAAWYLWRSRGFVPQSGLQE